MIAQDGFYSGLVTPRWNEIDKIHQGPASTLDPTDEIFLGRYILVKYTKNVYGQDDRYRIIASNGEGLTDAMEIEWYNCYQADKEAHLYDSDGVVFKKIAENGKLIYTPIAQLSTTYSSASIPGEVKKEVDKALAEFTPRIQWKEFF